MTPSIRTNGLKRHLKIIEWVDCYHVLEEIDDNRGIEYKCLTERVLEYEVAKRTIVLLSFQFQCSAPHRLPNQAPAVQALATCRPLKWVPKAVVGNRVSLAAQQDFIKCQGPDEGATRYLVIETVSISAPVCLFFPLPGP